MRRTYSPQRHQSSDVTRVCANHQASCAVGTGGLTMIPMRLQQTAAMLPMTVMKRGPAAPRQGASAARVQLPP